MALIAIFCYLLGAASVLGVWAVVMMIARQDHEGEGDGQ